LDQRDRPALLLPTLQPNHRDLGLRVKSKLAPQLLLYPKPKPKPELRLNPKLIFNLELNPKLVFSFKPNLRLDL